MNVNCVADCKFPEGLLAVLHVRLEGEHEAVQMLPEVHDYPILQFVGKTEALCRTQVVHQSELLILGFFVLL